MKKTYALLAASLFTVGVAAQNPTAYFMEGSTLRSQFNPAFAPQRGYFNIPGLGGIQVSTGGNLALDNVLYPRDGRLVTLIDGSVSAAEALDGLKQRNLLGTDTRVNILGFGAYTRNRKNFWSFDINARVNADVNLPYSLFEFLKQGKEGDIRDIGVTTHNYLEAGFNYSFPLMHDRLYVGVRAKLLVGVARGKLTYDHFRVTLDEDLWKIDASGQLDLTGGGMAREDIDYAEDGTYKPGDISPKPTKPAGYGFAVDLGATYDILPDLQASLAVNDLGFISWSKKYNSTGVSAKNMEFTGMTVDQNGTSEQPDFDLDILEFTPAEARSTSKMLRASINAGLEYKVWRRKIGLGLLYSARIWEYKTLHNITGSVNFQPIEWFTLTGSYSVIDNRGGAVGLALNLSPSWIHFFLAADVLTTWHTSQWVPIKQSAMNVTLGLGVPIGRRGLRSARCSRCCAHAE